MPPSTPRAAKPLDIPLPKQEEQPQIAPAPSVAQTPVRCRITDQPDGTIEVNFLIDTLVAHRLRTRVGKQDMAHYLWVNVINPALQGHVY